MAYLSAEDEMLARLRRIETRQSVHMEAQGVASQVRRPERCGDGSINAPSRGTAIQDILALMSQGEATVVYIEGGQQCLVTKF